MLIVEFVPTYEYECPQCCRTWEVRQRISEPALTTCERCGGPVRRLLAAAPFILKGGGWYVTDYPSEARKKAMSTETGDKGSAGSPDKAASSADAPPSSPGKSAASDSDRRSSGGDSASSGSAKD